MTRGLLDTSVFIARESRGLDAAALPDELAVSIVTYAELRAGVLAATEVPIRSRRLTALQAVTELNPLPIDTGVADHWAVAITARTDRERINVNDTWIAATAMAHDVAVVTQDADFDALAELIELHVIHV